MKVGLFPIRDHYTEPLFNFDKLSRPLHQNRRLPGIDWNTQEQLDLLNKFNFNEELKGIPLEKGNGLTFYMNNGAFQSGEAEFLYNIIRLKKPLRIFEIGSGHSTLLTLQAIKKNKEELPSYFCKHLCIEPYEMPWLEKTGATIIRKCVEDIGVSFFSELEKGDLLFIDSSHVIRPQGDILFEYLELLPSLKPGVIVHIHDIFSPRDYLTQWLTDEIRLWNEQYLVEAFLTSNAKWKIIGALNYLSHNYFDAFKTSSPFLTKESQPSSLYIEKIA